MNKDEEIQFLKDAINEAIKRYPNSNAAAFLFPIVNSAKPTKEDMEWAREEVAKIDHERV